MKKVYSVLIGVLMSILAFGADMQADLPFCNEEYTWVYETSISTLWEMKDASIDYGAYEMKFVGTKEMQGRTYHVFKVARSIFREYRQDLRLYVYHVFGPEDMKREWLLRDDGPKVWYWHEEWQKEVLMYDFGVKHLDPMPGVSWGDKPLAEDSTYCAWRLDYDYCEDCPTGSYCIGEWSGTDYFPHESPKCIEGIGVTRGSMCYIYTFLCWHFNEAVNIDNPGGDCCMLTGVMDKDGKYIYGEPNTIQKSVSSVNTVKMNEDKAPRYFNLQGNPLAQPRPGELVLKVTASGTEKVIYREN